MILLARIAQSNMDEWSKMSLNWWEMLPVSGWMVAGGVDLQFGKRGPGQRICMCEIICVDGSDRSWVTSRREKVINWTMHAPSGWLVHAQWIFKTNLYKRRSVNELNSNNFKQIWMGNTQVYLSVNGTEPPHFCMQFMGAAHRICELEWQLPSRKTESKNWIEIKITLTELGRDSNIHQLLTVTRDRK